MKFSHEIHEFHEIAVTFFFVVPTVKYCYTNCCIACDVTVNQNIPFQRYFLIALISLFQNRKLKGSE